MSASKCRVCGREFESAVIWANAVCLRCLASLFDEGDFEKVEPSAQVLKPLVPREGAE